MCDELTFKTDIYWDMKSVEMGVFATEFRNIINLKDEITRI